MKLLILIVSIAFLVSCGPAQEEKETLAKLTCNIMGESRRMDAAFRIKEINAARKEIGEPAYLGTDETIRESITYNLCPEIVLNDPAYTKKLDKAKRKVNAFLEEAHKKKAEAQRLAAEEKAEAERIPRQNWRKAIRAYYGNNLTKIIAIEALPGLIQVHHTCKPGLSYQIYLKAQNSPKTITLKSYGCDDYKGYALIELPHANKAFNKVLDKTISSMGGKGFIRATSLIEKAEIAITGIDEPTDKSLLPGNHPPLNWQSQLKQAVVMPMKLQ